MCEVRSAKCEMRNVMLPCACPLPSFYPFSGSARYSPFFQLRRCSPSQLGVFLSSDGTPYSSALWWPGLPCVSSSLADYPSVKLASRELVTMVVKAHKCLSCASLGSRLTSAETLAGFLNLAHHHCLFASHPTYLHIFCLLLIFSGMLSKCY